MTDTLREIARHVANGPHHPSCPKASIQTSEYRCTCVKGRARAALAAAQQPMGCGLPCGFDCNGACFDWAAAPQPAPTHECPVCEETVTWNGPDRPYCGECAADNGRDIRMRPISAAPQPAPDREELVRLLRIITRNGSLDDGRTLHEIIADALLARGLRLPGGEETIAWAAKIILSQPKRPDSPVAEAFTVACAHLEDRECGAETTNEIIETFLKALAGEDN